MDKARILTFEPAETTQDREEGLCGYIIENRDPAAIHIFEIEENPGRPFNNVLIGGCAAIRDQLFPGRPLSEIQWRYSNGICHSEIGFTEKAGQVAKIHLSSDELGGEFYKRPLSTYQSALYVPEGFESHMSSGHGFLKGPSRDIFPVALDDVEDGYAYFKPCGYGSPASQTILVDSQKFIDAWIRQENNLIEQAQGKGMKQSLQKIFGLNTQNSTCASLRHDYRLFESTPETSLSYLDGASSIDSPIETGLVNYNAKEGGIGFTNGRHRTFNTANAGSKYVVMTVDGDVQAFKEKFEWHGDNFAAPATKWPLTAGPK